MKPRSHNGKPITVNDAVRRLDDKAPGDVMEVLPGAAIVVRWPSGLWSKHPAKTLTRVAP